MKKFTNQTIQKQYLLEKVRSKLLPLVTIVGSLLIILGTLLPWISVLGGLQTYSGITGFNGRMLLAAGTLSFVGGVFIWIKQFPLMQWIIGLYGFVLLSVSSWLLLELWKTYQTISNDGMVIGGIGPGLFVTTAGALFLFASLFLPQKHLNNNRSEVKLEKSPNKIALAIVILFFLVGSSIYMTQNKGIVQASQQNQSCSHLGQKHLILIQDNAFVPDKLTVPRCDVISFENKDKKVLYLPALGDHQNHAHYAGFTEKVLGFNQENTFTAQTKGVFKFHDHLKDQIEGILTIN